MRVPPQYPGHLRFARYAFIAITAALVGYRLYRAAGMSTADLITSLSTVAALIGATAAGYMVRLRELRHRAEHADYQAEAKALEAAAAKHSVQLAQEEITRLREVARQQSQQTSEDHAREEEERSWWEPKTVDHDTIAFGKTVIPMELRRRLNERDLY